MSSTIDQQPIRRLPPVRENAFYQLRLLLSSDAAVRAIVAARVEVDVADTDEERVSFATQTRAARSR